MPLNKNTISELNKLCQDTLVSHLNIEFTEVSEGNLKAKMPVTQNHLQIDGIMHGGALLALAETVGSAASLLVVDTSQKEVRGFDISANHVKSTKSGYVYAEASPVHLGRTTQIWHVHIKNDEDQLVSLCKITNIIIDKR